MSESEIEWNVLPYEPIEQLAPNIWSVEGDLPEMALHRRMVIIKRTDGELVIHSCMALHEDDMKEIESWGKPAYLLVPNGWHRLDAAAYKLRYPDIKVLCPEGSRKKISEVIDIDGTYDDFPFDEAIQLQHLEGINKAEGVVIIRHLDENQQLTEERTLLFNDAIFNQPHLPGFGGWIIRLLGSTGGPKVTRIFRWLTVKNKKAYKTHLLRLAETPNIVRIIVSHGHYIEDNPAQTLKQIAKKL